MHQLVLQPGRAQWRRFPALARLYDGRCALCVHQPLKLSNKLSLCGFFPENCPRDRNCDDQNRSEGKERIKRQRSSEPRSIVSKPRSPSLPEQRRECFDQIEFLNDYGCGKELFGPLLNKVFLHRDRMPSCVTATGSLGFIVFSPWKVENCVRDRSAG
jgi:hypothetical protein